MGQTFLPKSNIEKIYCKYMHCYTYMHIYVHVFVCVCIYYFAFCFKVGVA
jgi:hypothetical protein